jgi:predicted transcriptional regulator
MELYMKKERVRVNFDASKELIEKAKSVAENKDITLSMLIRQALEAYIVGGEK